MENNNKKKLNVVFADNRVDQEVVKFLNELYDLTIVKNYNKNHRNEIAIPDLIIFTGGEDVSPELYGEKKGSFTNSNATRDLDERLSYDLHRGLRNKIPKLGICRGAQFLTVMNGGKLIQHVEGHNNISHNIQLQTGGIIKIASDHHQMMYPFNLNEKAYELIGYSERHLSTVYLNGNNKNIDIPFPFYEPEIVYYPNTNSFCIQAHPEWEVGSRDSDAVLRMIDKYLFYKTKEIEKPFAQFNDNYIEDQYEEDFEFEEQQDEPFLVKEKPIKKEAVTKKPNPYIINFSTAEELKTQYFNDLKIRENLIQDWGDNRANMGSIGVDLYGSNQTLTPKELVNAVESVQTEKIQLLDVIEQITKEQENEQ